MSSLIMEMKNVPSFAELGAIGDFLEFLITGVLMTMWVFSEIDKRILIGVNKGL